MWIATTTGFYSAVQHRTDNNLLVVRTRVHEDAMKLAQRAFKVNAAKAEKKIIAYKQSDYPWRVIVTKGQWASFVAQEAQRIDYPNFKSAVQKRQGKVRETIYHSVWSVLLRLEKLDRVDVDDYRPTKRGRRKKGNPAYYYTPQPSILDELDEDVLRAEEEYAGNLLDPSWLDPEWIRLRQWLDAHGGE